MKQLFYCRDRCKQQDRKTVVSESCKANTVIGPNEVILVICYFVGVFFKLKNNTKVNAVLSSYSNLLLTPVVFSLNANLNKNIVFQIQPDGSSMGLIGKIKVIFLNLTVCFFLNQEPSFWCFSETAYFTTSTCWAHDCPGIQQISTTHFSKFTGLK